MRVTRPMLAGIATRALAQGESGSVVLFLHGYTDSADTWRRTFEELRGEGLRCVAVDLPSHGEAAFARRPVTLGSLDEFVAATVRAHDSGEGVVLVGNSLGGLLALRAGADPGLPVNGVVSLGAPDGGLHRLLATLPATRTVLLGLLALPLPGRLLGHVASIGYARLAGVGPGGRSVARHYRGHLTRQRLRELVDVGATVIAELHAATSPMRADGFAFGVPLVQVWGDRDRICPMSPGRAQDSGVRVIGDLGHCPQVERPRLVADLVREVAALAAGERSQAS